MRKIEPELITGMGYIGDNPGVLYHMGGAGEQTVVTGNPALLEGVKGSRFTALALHGKSTQGSTTGAQLFDKSKAFAGWVNSDGSINNAGTVGKGNNIVSEYIPFEAGKQYFCGSDFVWIYNTEKGFVKKADTELKDGVFTSPDNAGFFVVASSVSAEKALAKSNEIMINVGSVRKPYEPYTGGAPSPSPSYPQEIESAGQDGEIRVEVLGKNLLRIDDSLKKYDSNDYEGTSKRIISAGMVAVGLDDVNRFLPNNVSNCVIGNGNIAYHTQSAGFSVGIGAKLTSEQTYICSYESTNNGRLCLLYYSSDGTFLGKKDSVKTKTAFTIPKNVVYTVILFRDADLAGDYKFWNIQLESGDVATDYEPYKSQTLIIPTPGGLPGIPVSSGGNYTDAEGQQWVCDEIDLAKGERVQWVKTVVLDGTESWEAQSGANYFSCQKQIDAKNDVPLHGLSPNIRVVNHAVIDSTQEQNVIAYTYFWRLRLADIDMQNGATVDDLKAFLSKNPITVYYASDVPIRTPLPPETIAAYKKLHTYSPTTTVINDAGAGMSVGYRRRK